MASRDHINLDNYNNKNGGGCDLEVPSYPKSDKKSVSLNLNVPKWGTSSYSLMLALLGEFMGVLFIVLVATISRGLNVANPVVAPFAIGMTTAFVMFAFGMYYRAHMNPTVTVLHMVTQTLDVFTGFMYLLAQLIGAFAGAGLARLLIDTVYFNAAIIVDPLVTGLISADEGLAIEFFGEFLIGFIALQLSIFAIDVPTSALFLGLGTIGLQFFGYPISSACFNVFRWLAVNAVGATSFYWPTSAWVYPVAMIMAVIIAAIIHYLFKYLKNAHHDAPKQKVDA